MQQSTARSLLQVFALLVLAMSQSTDAAPGEVDLSFMPIVDGDGVSAISIQPDRKILLGGGFTNVNGRARAGLARLNPDGSLDVDFDPGTGLGGTSAPRPLPPVLSAIALQGDGKVLLAGRFATVAGVSRNGIARLNPDGSVDTSFDPGTGVSFFPGSGVEALALQPDGKILIGGSFASVNGTNRDGVARLNADGSLDDTLFTIGIGPQIRGLLVQPDGKVIVAGSFYSTGYTYPNVMRLRADGVTDESFDPRGVSPDVASIALQSDGKLLIGGNIADSYYGAPYPMIGRLGANGTMDLTFDAGSGANGSVRSIAVQPDGKVLIVGDFTAVNGQTRIRIARLNSDGTVDDSFDPGLGLSGPCTPFCPPVSALALQPDGKILVGGSFTIVNGSPRKYIARWFGHDLPRLTAVMVTNDAVALSISAAPNARLRLETSDDLADWSASLHFTNDIGSFRVTEDLRTAPPVRFYRLVWLP